MPLKVLIIIMYIIFFAFVLLSMIARITIYPIKEDTIKFKCKYILYDINEKIHLYIPLVQSNCSLILWYAIFVYKYILGNTNCSTLKIIKNGSL